MRAFIVSLLAVAVFSVIIEIFCPPRFTKTAVYMAVSLAVLIIIAGGIRSLFKAKTNGFGDEMSFKLETTAESILSLGAESTKKEVLLALKKESIEVTSLELDYYIDELQIVYESVNITVEQEMDTNQAKKIVLDLINIDENEVHVWVSG